MSEPTPNPPTVAELARLAGCPADKVQAYVERGLVGAGGLDEADVTAIRLIDSLEAAGLAAESFVALVENGTLSFDFARNMMAFPVTMSGRSYRDLLRDLDLDVDFAKATFIAAGLPALDADRVARDDDVAFLTLVARVAQSGISRRSLLRVIRVYGHALRRIAEAQRDLFTAEVEEPLIASGASIGTFLDETARRRQPLQRVGVEAAQLMLRRILEDLVFENIAVRLQTAMAQRGFAPAASEDTEAVGFADLSGYTDYLSRFGDELGAEKAAQLEEIAQEVLESASGRIIKALGDGLLIHFRRPAAALPAAAKIIARAADADLPPIHIGLAAGPMIFRDGDIFGVTVNRAARLAAQAEPGTILADDAMRRLSGADGREWRAVSLEPLKGLPDTVAFQWIGAEPNSSTAC